MWSQVSAMTCWADQTVTAVLKCGYDTTKTASTSRERKYTSATGCSKSSWNGSAININGNYQWRDVAKVAAANNVIVATAGSVSVGAIGGWPSGGGHGPATNSYGFGADQILEAEVLLADGRIVIENVCENSDLYRALRGGGPGYGIVLSTTVKAWPNVDVVTAHHLTVIPLNATAANSTLLGAVSILLQEYPRLIDAGVAGYTYWYNNYITIAVANSTSGYPHGVWTIGQDLDAARAALKPVIDRLQQKFNSSLTIQDDYATYSDYWSFYHTETALNAPESKTMLMSSGMIENHQVSNFTAVRDAVEIITNAAPGQYNSNCVLLVGGGGQVVRDGKDPYSGLNPAWRRASYAVVAIRTIPLHYQ